MCRIFFSLQNRNVQLLLKEFLAQSIHSKKHTPTIANDRDHDMHPDGFGITWKSKNTDDWTIYKQPMIYTKDPNIDTIIDSIPNHLVISHIRKKTQGDISLENTHPFYYKGQIFAQNGKINDYEKNKHLLKSYIIPGYVSEISGETDSEYLFFMFLSCKKYLENRKTNTRKNNARKNNTLKNPETSKSFELTNRQITAYRTISKQLQLKPKSEKYSHYFNAFTILIHIFKQHNIELVANIIYGNNEIVLISRYIFYDKVKYKEKQIPPSLYWNKCSTNGDTGVLITSEPLSKYESMVIPENTVTIVDYKKYELVVQRV